MDRRTFVASSALLLVSGRLNATPRTRSEERMFGVIGKIVATSGNAEKLAQVLLDGSQGMEGCLSYIVARDATEQDAIWVTEVWESEAAHRASLETPQVQEAIAKGRPMIQEFGERFTTTPLGGEGLVTR